MGGGYGGIQRFWDLKRTFRRWDLGVKSLPHNRKDGNVSFELPA